MSKPHKIERMYAWIATDNTGEDGIPAVHTPHGPLPLVGSDKARIESFRHMAEEVNRDHGFPVRLVEFTGMVVLETLPGRGTPPRHQ